MHLQSSAAIYFSTPESKLERSLINHDSTLDDRERKEVDDYFDSALEVEDLYEYEELERKGYEELPPPNLRSLQEGLRYVFLDEENKCLLIINDDLSSEESNKLLQTLTTNRGAFVYVASDIKGRSFDCDSQDAHVDFKPFVDTQKILNPRM
jgi:hypothetical protein